MTKKAGSEEEVKEKSKSKKKKQGFSLKGIKTFLIDERTHQTFGLLLLLFSLFLFAAFISHLWYWQSDSAISGANTVGELLIRQDLQVKNWLGKLGAILADYFMTGKFGIAAFFIPFYLFLTSIKIITSRTLLPFGPTFRWGLFTAVWLSTFLGFALSAKPTWLILGGVYGYEMSDTLKGLIGGIGTGLLLLASLTAFITVTFKLNLQWNKQATPAEEAVEPSPDQEKAAPDFADKVISNLFGETEKPQVIDFDDTDPIYDDQVHEIENMEMEDLPSDEDDDSETIAETDLDDELAIENEPDLTMENQPEADMELETIVAAEDEMAIDDDGELPHATGDYDPKLELSRYKYPSLDLLENYGDKKLEINKEELEANKNKIVETLRHYDINIEKIKATIGPTVTLFEIVPQAGTRISKIKNLENDIALSIAALGIRIIAPIPGKGTIGIEVPNQKPEIVPMKNLLGSERFVNSEFDLPIALGKTISNEVFIADLAKMPHLLMAGATGQGKSVGLNAILVSLLYKKHPSQVKFVMVDPKKVELTLFRTIERHFLAKLPNEEEPIITDTKKVINTLNSLCIEMDQRYELLKDAAVRTIKEYNAKFIARKLNPNNGHRYLPYIVLVVDEFADLIMTAGKEVETPIARLAQLARAIGIHLIIATQRPSVNIITGTIKANFPARIAFRVSSKIDARTILDSQGAEQLIGKGDMLLSMGSDLIRLQCAFVDTPEVDRITEFIGGQQGYADAFLLPEYIDENGEGSKDISLEDRDPLFEDAAQIIVNAQQGSASLLQRKLKLGYNRAGRIIDQLEAARIIGPFEGSKAREVLIKDPMSLDQILQGLRNRNN
ncbi:MAG: hypothetical protein RIQ89_1082 [Bacteroidota bacterium]